ncbi:MAG: ABC transporter ATP-binding protein [Erythrobacter sp.]|nr:ABC transporter ATP-binding protein [Erythrobacter sp.]
MFRTYRLIWGLLTGRERRNFILLIFLTMVMTVFEVGSVTAILPFLSVLARPEMIGTNHALIWFAGVFNLGSHAQVMLALGGVVLTVVLVGMVVRAYVTYLQIRFSLMRAYAIASRLLRGYLQQDYVWFLSRNSAELSQSLLSEIDTVIREAVLPAVLVMSNFMVVLLIGGLLFAVEPWVAVGATTLLLSSYLLIYLVLRNRLGRISAQRLAANRQRFHVVQEVAGGIKELKVMGLEQISLHRFRTPAETMARNQSLGQTLTRLPRFALEAVVYGGFIAMVLFLIVVRGDDMADLIPLLGLIGIAGVKLFPAMQQIYQQLSSIRFSSASLEKLHHTMTTLAERPFAQSAAEPLHLTRQIELRGLHFRYPGAERDTLDGFSAVIAARTTLGIVGGTGAGKTTVIDILLGLLHPGAGEILVDGVAVTPDRVRAWQKSLGYVPQHIFLSDDTVAGNIAFGIPADKIDRVAVERAARVANLHEFVMSDLAQGYQTMVGERGVRLSGGQRQRIGIARALYNDPDVLILDEATSALDNVTERAVMEAVHNLGGKKTVIMIAHRLSTVENCDTIFLLEQGRLAAQGSYGDLLQNSENFRKMAKG